MFSFSFCFLRMYCGIFAVSDGVVRGGGRIFNLFDPLFVNCGVTEGFDTISYVHCYPIAKGCAIISDCFRAHGADFFRAKI